MLHALGVQDGRIISNTRKIGPEYWQLLAVEAKKFDYDCPPTPKRTEEGKPA